MADVSFATQAKSDQLNAVDIMGFEPVLTIREVRVQQGEQPVWVFYHGDNNRPWKPSRGMIRILAAGWGRDSDGWVGKSVQVFMEPSVKYAGKEVGGVRIRAMSDIPNRGLTCTITINRQKREPYPVARIDMARNQYPKDKFDAGLAHMVAAMNKGQSLEQIIAQCQKTGDLTSEQIATLQDNAPLHTQDGE